MPRKQQPSSRRANLRTFRRSGARLLRAIAAVLERQTQLELDDFRANVNALHAAFNEEENARAELTEQEIRRLRERI